MASITVEIVSKSSSEAGTVFVLAASHEEIASAGFVPYFIDQRFAGLQQPTTPRKSGCGYALWFCRHGTPGHGVLCVRSSVRSRSDQWRH